MKSSAPPPEAQPWLRPCGEPLDDEEASRCSVQVDDVRPCSAAATCGAPKTNVLDMSVTWNAVRDQVDGEKVRLVMARLAYDPDRHATTRCFLKIRNRPDHSKPEQNANKSASLVDCKTGGVS